jgi:hypothetical protein
MREPIGDVMREVAHRPWPLPAGPWIMTQTWHDLLFAHWRVPPARLQDVMPHAFQPDTFDGSAWVGIVPFHMSGVRLRGLPGFPGLSAFAEINLRTYVTVDGKPGVFFWSLDAASAVAVAAARLWYRLPYFRARIAVAPARDRIRYASRRTHSRTAEATFVAEYGPAGAARPPQPGTIEHWLTERYCLYTLDRRQRVCRAEVHHLPWPLQPAAAEIERSTLAAAHGIVLPPEPPLVHFSKRQDVRVWPLRRVAR